VPKFSMNRLSGVVLRLYFFFWPWLRLKVSGIDSIPATGAAVLVPKHQRYCDIIALTAAVKREIRYMAKRSLFKNPVFGWYLRSTGTFPVTQESADTGAIKTAAEKLRQGEVLGLFAEGTRIPGNKVGEIQPGLILAVSRSETDCPIVPCGIAYRQRGRLLHVSMFFGQPFRLSELPPDKREQLLEIRRRLQAAQDVAVQKL